MRLKNWTGHVVFIVCIGILCSLGAWQLHRRQWKNDIVAQINTRNAAPPLTSHWLDTVAISDVVWRKIAVSGTCQPPDMRLWQGKYLDGQAGAYLVCAARLGSGKNMMVNFGWVPLDFSLPPADAAAQPFTAIALLKPYSPHLWYLPPDDIAQRRVVTLQQPDNSYPVYADIVADYPRQTAALLAAAQPTGHLPELRNEHLAYAITWFTLAIIAVIIYGVRIYGKPSRIIPLESDA